MICKRCKGRGTVKGSYQLNGEEGDEILALLLAVMTFGLSLFITTKHYEHYCPRCHGKGEIKL